MSCPIPMVILPLSLDLLVCIELFLAILTISCQPWPDWMILCELKTSSPTKQILKKYLSIFRHHQSLVMHSRLEAHMHMQSTGRIHNLRIILPNPRLHISNLSRITNNFTYCEVLLGSSGRWTVK